MHSKRKHNRIKRRISLLLVLTLVLSGINADILVSYAAPNEVQFMAGENVTATLYESGLLRLSGVGDTFDYAVEEDNYAPFYDKRADIRTIEIDAGITSVGDYLFYNCENLTGTLTIPSTVVSIGDYAFSGESYDTAPKFTIIYNEFTDAEIVSEKDKEEGKDKEEKEKEEEKEEEKDEEETESESSNKIESTSGRIFPLAMVNLFNPSILFASTEASPAPEIPTEPVPETPSTPESPVDTENPPVPALEVPSEPGTPSESTPGTPSEPTPEIPAEPTPETTSGSEIPSESGHSSESDNAVDTNRGSVSSDQIQDKSNDEQHIVETITQQVIGNEIFFPGQIGVFKLSSNENKSFLAAVESAGYTEITGYTELTFISDTNESIVYITPVTTLGAFLPDYSETGLTLPDDAQRTYKLMGWKPKTSDNTDDEGAVQPQIVLDLFAAHSFYNNAETSLKAVFSVTDRDMQQQTIYTDVNNLRVTISGNLPVDAIVSANCVNSGTASELAGDCITDASSVVTALDIAILVDGMKYQPSECGERVSVSISGIDVDMTEVESLSVLHIPESESSTEPEVLEVSATTGDTVEFIADSFSVYIITRQQKSIDDSIAQPLDFCSEAKMADETDALYRNGTDVEDSLYLSSVSDRVNYRLTLRNNSGGIVPAGNFAYYIPIPRNTADMATHMMKDNTAPAFDLVLTGPVTVTGTNPDIYDLQYSMDATALNYDNGKADYDYTESGVTWKTKDQMSGDDWAQVKMIKLVATDPLNGYIPTDTVDRFSMTLGYTGDEESIIRNAGCSAVWRCCGMQNLEGYELNLGTHTPTEFVNVMLRSEDEENVTLTAYSGAPSHEEGVSKCANIQIPAYTNVKNIKILSIETENVVLHDSDTVSKNAATATSETANGSFAITAQLNDGEVKELSTGIDQELGTTSAGVSSNLILTLSNYNALSDVSTPRGVTVVLGDNNGVQIAIHITINRLATTVTSASTHIEGGKSYQLMHGSNTAVTITQDSAFTAQYALRYQPANCDAHVLSLLSGEEAKEFPQGTTLTLIDQTDAATPKYYYYRFNIAASSVCLSSFTHMSGSGFYPDQAKTTESVEIDEKILLIADFSAAQMQLFANDYTLRMSLNEIETVDDVDMSITVKETRAFSLSAEASATSMSDSISVSGTALTTCDTSSDSNWSYRKMALVITLDSGVDFPAGTLITMGDTQYVPSGKAFILPLGDLGTYQYTYTLVTPHTQLSSGAHRLNTALYVSGTSSAEAPMGGVNVRNIEVEFDVIQKGKYALKLDVGNDKHLFTKTDAESMDLKILYNEATAGTAITLEVQEKVGGIYLTRTNLIEDASVDATTYSVNNHGVIQFPGWPYKSEGLDVTLKLKKNNLSEDGTYRILAKTVGAGENIETAYNFVIIEKDDM